eukprot:m.12355 g.12355  ORF g.12355 m.12355 type:complete len:567 (+) comp6847_c0_seq1:108-1808(+)
MFKRQRKPKAVQQKTVLCCVHLPNDNSIHLSLALDATGLDLWQDVMETLSIPEQDFFGLKYLPRLQDKKRRIWKKRLLPQTSSGSSLDQQETLNYKALIWLALNEKLRDQLSSPEPYNGEELPSCVLRPDEVIGTWHVYVFIRFYVSDRITSSWSHPAKELLFHQLRHDLAFGVLTAPTDLGITLSGYALHAIEGDFKSDIHSTTEYLQKYQFFPRIDNDILIAIQHRHRQCRGMITATDAMTAYIKTCQHLEGYGVIVHQTMQNGAPILLGVSLLGLTAYKDQKRLYAHSWKSLKKLDVTGKTLSIVLLASPSPLNSDDESNSDQKRLEFIFPTPEACKEFWRTAVQFHTFYHQRTPTAKSMALGYNTPVTLHQAIRTARGNSQLLLQAGVSSEALRLPTPRNSVDAMRSSLSAIIAGVDGLVAQQQSGSEEKKRQAVLLSNTPDVLGGLIGERGEIVEIVDSQDHDWWLVRAARDVGRVPARAVLEFSCDPHQVVEAVVDFASEELAFNKGDVLFLIKEGAGMMVVSTGDAHGQVPDHVINFDFAKSRFYEEDVADSWDSPSIL